jgi:LPPG:FO 2-phospho-L-lactate transferase
MRVVALSGGVGGAKLVSGLSKLIPPEELTVIANTGDDFRWHGLLVSPDLDTIVYTLSGFASRDTGWGVHADTFHCLNRLRDLGCEDWFRVGDRDLATHIYRTDRLAAGWSLTEVTRRLCTSNGIRAAVLPMTDSPVPTMVSTADGTMAFQDYFVRYRCEPQVRGFAFQGIESAKPAAGLIDALYAAEGIILCPSNPFISIGPILGVPGVRTALQQTEAKVLAVSPIIAGAAVRGPAAAMLAQLGHEVSAAGVAALYDDFLDLMILDNRDEELVPRLSSSGLETLTAQTIMETEASKTHLAGRILKWLAGS